MTSDEKRRIRKEIIRRLEDQDPALRDERSLKIQQKLLSSEEFRAAKTVMTYVSMPTEVGTMFFLKQALEQGKKVSVPYIGTDRKNFIASELNSIKDLEEGPYGIYQPKEDLVQAIPLKEIDLVVVPAIAFDSSNMRLGRGKGYYDRFLSNGELCSVKTIGLAFGFQILDDLPSAPHDRPVMKVLTD